MKIVLAPDSFKGSLTAAQACDALETGIRRVFPLADIIKVPMADGGEGTVQSLVDAVGGRINSHVVRNPLGQPVDAKFGIVDDGRTAVIEMAEASGLYLIPIEQRNPLITCTYGTGELIRKGLDLGCRNFILGLGGSATNDGGAGLARALGVRFLDAKGYELAAGGAALADLASIDVSGLDARLLQCTFTAACDVDNPICGTFGASRIFGPQKGATPEMVEILDSSLSRYADVLERDLQLQVKNLPGGGAAGGLGAGLVAFLNVTLRRGVDIVIEYVGLEGKLADADLVFTGEGRCDDQTERGKTPYGVSITAQKQGVPVILIAGKLGPGVENMQKYGVISLHALADGNVTDREAMAQAYDRLADKVEEIMRRPLDMFNP